MPGFDGTGPGGMGPMTGGGRGYCHPLGMGNTGAYRLPRWAPYADPYYYRAPFYSQPAPYTPYMSRKEEINLLKRQADILSKTLEEIDERITELAGEGS